MKHAVLVCALAACGGPAKPAAVGNVAATSGRGAERLKCPSQAEFTSLARSVWFVGEDPDDAELEDELSCGSFVRQGEALWLIYGYTANYDLSAYRRLLLVTPDGKVRFRDDKPFESHELERYLEDEFGGVDLDGDGDDEVIHHASHAHGGYSSVHLVVSKIVGDKLTAVRGEPILLSEDNSGAAESAAELATCDGTLGMNHDSGPLQIHVEYAGENCPWKERAFELRDGALVELTATNASR